MCCIIAQLHHSLKNNAVEKYISEISVEIHQSLGHTFFMSDRKLPQLKVGVFNGLIILLN